MVIAGLAFVFKEAYPLGPVSDNYFILVMLILSAFFGFLGVIALIMRFNNIRFRRKFAFSLFGVANFCIGGLSILYSILHPQTWLTILTYVFSFLAGIAILADIFFGKRNPSKFEREVLTT